MQTVSKSKGSKRSQQKKLSESRQETGATSISKAADGKAALTEVSSEERNQLIAEAAYFRAEQRNFAPGCELDDWLRAEAEIEMRLSPIDISNMPKND